MRFKLEDREYEFDGTLTVEEAMFLQDKCGLGVNEVDQALFKGNPYAIAAWMYTLKRRAGEAVRWTDMMKMDIRTYEVIPDETAKPAEQVDDVSPGQNPDPTQTDGMTPGGDITGT